MNGLRNARHDPICWARSVLPIPPEPTKSVTCPKPNQPLIAHFAQLARGTTRLGVAGKIMDAVTAQRCLEHGADFVLIGRGAMLHHDFARRALTDPGFQSIARPVTRAYLQAEGMGPNFIDYVASTWKHFVSDAEAQA